LLKKEKPKLKKKKLKPKKICCQNEKYGEPIDEIMKETGLTKKIEKLKI